MKKRYRFLLALLAAVCFGALLSGCESEAGGDDGDDDTQTYTCTITFNANDGTASPATATQSFTVSGYSASVTLNANTFTRSGYTFQGWATSATSTTVAYADKATATLYSDTTLYAVWKSDTYAYSYTITFDGNGGATAGGATTTTQVAAGNSAIVKVALDANPFAKSGFVFVGWASTKTATTASYTDGASYSAYGDTTLYAVWASGADALTLTLDANDGSGSTKKITVTSGQSVRFSSYGSAFTSDHATLTAFNTQADGEGTSYSVAESAYKSMTVTETTTLYAVWMDNPKITFNGNGGTTSGGDTETYQYLAGTYAYNGLTWEFVPEDSTVASEGSATATLDANPFTRSGYVFKGWATYAGATATYADKAEVEEAFTRTTLFVTVWSGKTLYAVWQKVPAITYNMNGGSTMANFTENSTTITSRTPTASYSYYTFAGWSTSSTATSATYTAGDNPNFASDTVTLYAVWKLGTIVSNKAISVAKSDTGTVASFTLLKTESVKITISNPNGQLDYKINNGTTDVYTKDDIGSAQSFTTTLSAGTYTISAKNNNIFSTHTATVTLTGN